MHRHLRFINNYKCINRGEARNIDSPPGGRFYRSNSFCRLNSDRVISKSNFSYSRSSWKKYERRAHPWRDGGKYQRPTAHAREFSQNSTFGIRSSRVKRTPSHRSSPARAMSRFRESAAAIRMHPAIDLRGESSSCDTPDPLFIYLSHPFDLPFLGAIAIP